MPATIISDPLDGEQIVAVDPAPQLQLDDGWQHRIRFFTGRAVTDVALTSEQDYRSGHLVRTGQLLSPGVAVGLVLTIDATSTTPRLLLSAGYGVTRSGEDVSVPAGVAIPLGSISVFDPVAEAIGAPPPADTAVTQNFAAWSTSSETKPPAGIFVLRPIRYTIAGQTASAADGTVDITAQLLSSPDRDPGDYAFEDWQMIDGSRLVFYAWPTDFLALPAPGPLFHNQLVSAIFAKETAFGRDDGFPWELAGVPVGVVGFDAAWKPLFLDRSSVVRVGGFPRWVLDTPFEDTWPAPNPFLAEAQIRQFLEQVSDLAIPAATPLSTNFQVVPPVGILAPAAFNLANFPTFLNHAFPSTYTVTAEPVFSSELDSLVSDSAELAPLDLTVADTVSVLVPVAEADFDPALLSFATPNPAFAADIAAHTADRLAALKHRLDLRKKLNALLTPLALPVTDLNADVTADEQADITANPAYTPPAGEDFGTAAQADGSIASTDYVQLQTAATALKGTLFTDADIASLQQNIPDFVADLNARIQAANDVLDLGFLRSQTDIYRYRQIMMQNTDATRLATSPVLAQIALGTSAPATTEQIDTFFTTARQQSYTPVASPPYKAPAPPLRTVVAGARSTTLTGILNLINKPVLNVVQTPIKATPVLNLPVSSVPIKGGPVLRLTGTRLPAITLPATARSVPLTGAAPNAQAIKPIVRPSALSITQSPLELADTDVSLAALASDTPEAVQNQQALVGAQYDFRTTSIAERLAQSPSQEAIFYTGQNRFDVTQSILQLPLQVDDLSLGTKDASGKTQTLGDARNSATVLQGLQSAPLPNDADEGAALSAGIQMLEQHVIVLRQVEGRIAQYTAFIQQANTASTNIQNNVVAIDSALKNVEDTLDNARDAVVFSTALLADEQARDNGINAQRAAVLKTVPFVVYCRPRELQATVSEPTRALVPDISEAVVPEFLASTAPVPPELRQMTALLRNAPLDWFPGLWTVWDYFERPDVLLSLAQSMQTVAYQSSPVNAKTSITLDSSAYADKLNQAYTNQGTVLETYRQQRAYFTPDSISTLPLSTARSVLQPIISLSDLTRSDVGSKVGTPVSTTVDQITAIANGVYQLTGQVLPATRLKWADALYGTSDMTDLSNLAILPGWGDVRYDLRYELQTLDSWLFLQMNQGIAAAISFMSDVMRVAILLASHAPVSQIIEGSSIHSAPLANGTPVRVTVPSPRIYTSMPVTVHNNVGTIIAHGTVNDLSTTEASVRITSVVDKSVTTLPAGSSIRYSASGRAGNMVAL